MKKGTPYVLCEPHPDSVTEVVRLLREDGHKKVDDPTFPGWLRDRLVECAALGEGRRAVLWRSSRPGSDGWIDLWYVGSLPEEQVGDYLKEVGAEPAQSPKNKTTNSAS